MRNYDFWKKEKSILKNNDNLILILSWIFYKTFDDDARFLSHKFWFKIKSEAWYESVWFPKIVLNQYLNKLEEDRFSYIVFEKEDWNYIQKLKNNWNQKLVFDLDNLNFLKEKQEKDKFKLFLRDLKNLIEKYE